MSNQELYDKIDQAVTKVARDDFKNWGSGNETDKYANGVASVYYDGIRIANGWGFDWVNEEGYPDAYYDAVIKGMKHALYAEHRAQNVREFFHQFF